MLPARDLDPDDVQLTSLVHWVGTHRPTPSGAAGAPACPLAAMLAKGVWGVGCGEGYGESVPVLFPHSTVVTGWVK